MISFFAKGAPKGQPRARAFARGGLVRMYDPGTAEGWKGAIAAAAAPHLPTEPLTIPLHVRLEFHMARPKGHYRTGRNAGQLRPDAPEFCTSKPDADNLAKAVLDALTVLGVWKDDAQVASLAVIKRYASGPAGADVLVRSTKGVTL